MDDANSIQWKRISVEAIAIVASILLAFSIDAWWEYRNDREGEQQVLMSLLREFDRIKVELDRSMDSLIVSHNATKRLLEFAGKNLTEEDKALIQQGFDELYVYNTFDPPSGALDSLMNAGKLDLILDIELRTRLASWSGLVRDYKEDEQEVDYLTSRDLGPMLDAIGPYPNVEELAPGLFESQWQEAFSDVRILNSISNVSGWIEATLEEASIVGSEVDQIITLVETELEK